LNKTRYITDNDINIIDEYDSDNEID